VEFKLKIEPQVYQEIQDCIDFYNERRNGFGRKFWIEISIRSLINTYKNPDTTWIL
jgi:hypothetical protein